MHKSNKCNMYIHKRVPALILIHFVCIFMHFYAFFLHFYAFLWHLRTFVANFFHRFFETEKQDPQAFIAFRMYVVMYGKKYFRSNSKISCSSSSGALTAVVLYFDCTLVLAPQAWTVHARRVHACVRACVHAPKGGNSLGGVRLN